MHSMAEIMLLQKMVFPDFQVLEIVTFPTYFLYVCNCSLICSFFYQWVPSNVLEHEQILEKKWTDIRFFFSLKDWLGIGISCQRSGEFTISGTVPEVSEWGSGEYGFQGDYGGAGLMVLLDDLEGSFQPWWFCDTVLWTIVGVFQEKSQEFISAFGGTSSIPGFNCAFHHSLLEAPGFVRNKGDPAFLFKSFCGPLSLCWMLCIILMQEYYYIFTFTGGLLWGFILT